MNKKRIALIVLAMMLVCVLSIAGTVAYLQAKTLVVTNTFIAAGGTGPFIDTDVEVETDEEGNVTSETVIKTYFELLEYKVKKEDNGKYVFVEPKEEVNEAKYDGVMPGASLPKQPFVKLSRTGTKYVYKTVDGVRVPGETIVEDSTPAPAYLFIEVVDGLSDAYKWSINSNWTELSGVEGPNKGTVYVWKNGEVLEKVDKDSKYEILTDNKIKVDDYASADQIGKDEANAKTLKFYAYLSQASVGDKTAPADVFADCFK